MAVLGSDGISIVTALAALTLAPAGVSNALQTRPRDTVTMASLPPVHVAVTVAHLTHLARNRGVAVVTVGTPEGREGEFRGQGKSRKYRQEGEAAGSGSISILTFRSWFLCILADTGHMTPSQAPPAHRWD